VRNSRAKYKIAILGASGMIGHKMSINLNIPEIELQCWVRSKEKIDELEKYIEKKSIRILDIKPSNFEILCFELEKFNPDYIINCVGVTIRKEAENKLSNVIFANSLLPHLLSNWTSRENKKLIHFSTDCVFNGSEDLYFDNSKPNEINLYGKSKSLGEVSYCMSTLTLRGSMIGRELFDKSELLEWFLNQNNEVLGFSETYYSGITTERMSKYVKKIILQNLSIAGLYNVSSLPISKLELLKIFKSVYQLQTLVREDRTKKSKKILKSEKFHSIIGEKIPSWEEDLKTDLIKEKIYYEQV
jgi:dTDP-4-dehydrorhamnose reductase